MDKEALYERLGHYGVKGKAKNGAEIKGYLKAQKDIPPKLCTGAKFRSVVAGDNGERSLIDKNQKPYGIPQGAPISDLLANLYLLKFDIAVNARVAQLGGAYYRYSDDILIVLPTPLKDALELEKWVRETIKQSGPKLQIKAEKSAVFRYDGACGGDQSWTRIVGHQGANGLEYLGFRYDGRRMFLRDSTLSNFQRKITKSAKRAAHFAAKRYPGKSAAEIFSVFNVNGFIQRYGRVEHFEEKADDVRNWTFWTYVTRAADELGALGRPIFRQLRRQRAVIASRIGEALEDAVRRRDNP